MRQLLLGWVGILLMTTALQAQVAPAIELQVEDVVSRLAGVMTTSAQSAASDDQPDVQMTTCVVQVADLPQTPSRVFLYQEQAMSNQLDRPYRQRFLQIAPSVDRSSVESISYRPIDAVKWVGLCNQPESARVIQTQDLDTAHCSVFLRRVEADYIGETQPGGCPSSYRGAVRVTNRIVLSPTGMDTLDRGLGVDGQQIWGANEEPYRFRRSEASSAQP